MKNELAVCVGLWLAEGDNKTLNEITFTNNSLELIIYFHNILFHLFKEFNPKIRIYIYNNKNKKIKIPIKNIQINHYIDKRATKPYYIWRLASKEIHKKWIKKVKEIKKNERLGISLLQGFIAGEGNIKFNFNSKSRAVRISQKNKVSYIELILDKLNINYKFRKKERNYYISGKWNLDILAKNKILDLHPEKKKLFWQIYNSYQEEHYPNLHLQKYMLGLLNSPKTSKEISQKLNRSQARITEELVKLKKEGKAINFRILSKDYWTKNLDILIISQIKKNYLDLLAKNRFLTSEVAKIFNVSWKSSYNRLKELEKLDLVEKNIKDKWQLKNNSKEVIVI